MKRLIPFLLIATLVVGCSERPVSTAKYFAGEPVAHWRAEIKSLDAKKRQHAADVLGNVGPIDPGAIPALTAALKDKDAKVRLAAVLALSKIGSPAERITSSLDTVPRSRTATTPSDSVGSAETRFAIGKAPSPTRSGSNHLDGQRRQGDGVAPVQRRRHPRHHLR